MPLYVPHGAKSVVRCSAAVREGESGGGATGPVTPPCPVTPSGQHSAQLCNILGVALRFLSITSYGHLQAAAGFATVTTAHFDESYLGQAPKADCFAQHIVEGESQGNSVQPSF